MKSRLLLFLLLLSSVYLFVVLYFHYSITVVEESGIILDDAIDAAQYYQVAARFRNVPIFQIEPSDITRESGGLFHTGYYYLSIFFFQISDAPMLMLRLFKFGLYLIALLYAATYVRQKFGTLSFYFFVIYLGLFWWEVVYYNFRNLRDGVIVSLCLILFTSVHKFLELENSEKKKIVKNVIVISLLLSIMGFFRLYMAVIVFGGLVSELLIRSKLSFFGKLVGIASIVTIFALLFPVFEVWDVGVNEFDNRYTRSTDRNVIIGMVKTLLSPIPWQYAIWFLVPSQVMYLIMLMFAFVHLFRRNTKKNWWQIFIVIGLCVFLGLMIDSSEARKRMPIVPIFAFWVAEEIGYLKSRSRRKRSHIKWQTKSKIIVESGNRYNENE